MSSLPWAFWTPLLPIMVDRPQMGKQNNGGQARGSTGPANKE